MNNEQKEQMIKTNAFDGISFDPEKRLLIQRSLEMSKDALDITGNKYGNLTAVRYSHTGKSFSSYTIGTY